MVYRIMCLILSGFLFWNIEIEGYFPSPISAQLHMCIQIPICIHACLHICNSNISLCITIQCYNGYQVLDDTWGCVSESYLKCWWLLRREDWCLNIPSKSHFFFSMPPYHTITFALETMWKCYNISCKKQLQIYTMINFNSFCNFRFMELVFNLSTWHNIITIGNKNISWCTNFLS